MNLCAFRLDDICAGMNWEHFNRICEIFDQYGIKPLLGVVPDNQDQSLHVEEGRVDFWDCIRSMQENGYVIAQHGYRHIYETKNKGILGLNPFSEFAGLPYQRQEEKIRRGKEILQKKGICVTIFMAPGHTYDRNTLKALRENGFTHVTDGYSNQCYRYKGLVFIPSRQSKPVLGKGMDTICLHINNMGDTDFYDVEQFIINNRQYICNFTDILQGKAADRGFRIRIEEWKNLRIRDCRRFVSSHAVLHNYLEDTADADSRRKKKKRICGLPGLAVNIIKSIFFSPKNNRS